ncbi:copper amine oxidase-like protein [Natranaerovirga pectinivora]|uniref:Copper amine oxidase-like protein n=1 Tax=Natranaerovirga pectinivora TaxID=682400 RepID=A0A4R3MM63_9FIRM|nr:copper amine oxidase N-terminal domain-containing protein [Natranaerovirga pectinivora]TCT15383.1 copper amine oxidase-like protein [Natranaerovirga pectinivora]
MKKRGLISLLIIVSMMLLLAGCNNTAAIGYYNLTKEVLELQTNNIVESEAEISFEFKDVPNEIFQEEFFKTVHYLLKEFSLIVNVKSDLQNESMVTELLLKNKVNDQKQSLIQIINKHDVMYFKFDDLVEFIKAFNIQELNELITFIPEGVKYLRLSQGELIEQYSMVVPEISELNYQIDTLSLQQKTIELYEGIIEAYSEYVFDYITEENGKYTISINAEEFIPIAYSFIKYSITNIETIGIKLTDFVDSFQDEEAKALFGFDKETVINGLGFVINDVKENEKEYIAALTEFTEIESMAIELLGNSKLEFSLEKLEKDIFKEVINLFVDINAEGENLSFNLDITQTTKKIDSLDLEIPTEGILDFIDVMENLMDIIGVNDITVMYVSLDTGEYILNKNNEFQQDQVNVILKDHRSYLPLRKVAETFDEYVDWDEELRKPYVARNGHKIYMEGFIVDGRAYVKVRDFETYLGYFVDWEAETNVATIIKL